MWILTLSESSRLLFSVRFNDIDPLANIKYNRANSFWYLLHKTEKKNSSSYRLFSLQYNSLFLKLPLKKKKKHDSLSTHFPFATIAVVRVTKETIYELMNVKKGPLALLLSWATPTSNCSCRIRRLWLTETEAADWSAHLTQFLHFF